MSSAEKRGIEQGIRQGREQGMHQGIRMLILDNLEDGKTKSEILSKIRRRFELTEEEAERCYVEAEALRQNR